VAISDISVAIYVSGAHRRDVLDAVSFLIEQLKANVPIWKKVLRMFLFFSFHASSIHIWSIWLFLRRSSMMIMRMTITITKQQHLTVGKKIN